jgi:maltooligosyltrehalose trehalohydrolase
VEQSRRRRPIGAELLPSGVHVRLWAPAHRSVSVVIGDDERRLKSERNGYFSGIVPGAAGTLYRFRLDDEDDTYPDPASRFQPQGPHGPSEVIDPRAYRWRDSGWRGVPLGGAVMSEVHIGTFTREGTWRAAAAKLPLMIDAGINVLEIMPVAEFPGKFGWGYDGVDLWAPARLYGRPDDFRAFVDRAHALGIAVILDVVYNHLGPDGCYLRQFTPGYFTKKYENEWGEAINFDGPESNGVREFFTENAAYWIDEFHLDGFRFDATQSIHDESRPHILRVVAAAARKAARRRNLLLVAENEPQDVRMIEEFGLDAMWNDDWHHSATVAVTGRNEAYYSDYLGTAHELVSMARRGFLYQGQHYRWQKKRRGTPSTHLESERMVCYLQNHDQLANSATGERLHRKTSPGLFRAMTALLLLGPNTPLLFQGQEFAASSPFLYFADHKGRLAREVAKGRREFLSQFPSLATKEAQASLAAPDDGRTFERCKLDWSERETNQTALALHRDLLALRRDDAIFAAQGRDAIEGAVFSTEALVLRWGDDRLLIVNLGRDLSLSPVNEPLLAPPRGRRWEMIWSSESPAYGGSGTPPLETAEGWRIPGHAAFVLKAKKTKSTG